MAPRMIPSGKNQWLTSENSASTSGEMNITPNYSFRFLGLASGMEMQDRNNGVQQIMLCSEARDGGKGELSECLKICMKLEQVMQGTNQGGSSCHQLEI